MIGKCRQSCPNILSTEKIKYAHSSAVTAWTPIWTDKYGVLIPVVSATAAEMAVTPIEFYCAGRFIFKIYTAITVAAGQIVYYLVATDDVTTTKPTAVSGTTAFPLGVAVAAGTATAGYVEVELFKNAVNLVIYKAVSAADEVSRIWGTTSATSGIFRGLSVRTFFTGAGTATGDALRVYNQTDVSIANMHGIHSTAQLGSETAASVGTVTGQAAGVRATIGIGLTNTAPAGGTIAAVRADSYFLSSAAGAASSFFYACDVGASYGVDCFLRLGTLVNRSTSKNTGSYQYIAGHQTPGNCDGSLKVVTPDGTFYLPLYASFS
jgi:hypothetical protein